MSKIKTNVLTSLNETDEVQIPTLDQRMAKAWVNFDGSGTISIRDSYNVSSVIDNGVGDYTINLTASLDNQNYCLIAGGNSGGTGGVTGQERERVSSSSFRVTFNTVSGDTSVDRTSASVVLFGS